MANKRKERNTITNQAFIPPLTPVNKRGSTLKKSAVPDKKIFLLGQNFSFSLAQWAQDQASCLPDKSLKRANLVLPRASKT